MSHSHSHSHPVSPADPVLVEVTRGDMVESRHRGAAAIVDSDGRVISAWGDIEAPVYSRSALKPIQAIPLIESGAAEHYGLGDAEIALSCASHGGEPRHAETVAAWLKKIGLSVADLECGVQTPSYGLAAEALLLRGEKPTALNNNCSGKHTGFLTVAVHKGEKTRGYIKLEHPVQQRILGVLEQLTDMDLGPAPKGIDGCGIPVIGVPLGRLALAFARMARPATLPKPRIAAIARIRKAMAAEPFMVAGSGRFCTRVMQALGERAVVKTGAEGVYIAILRDKGLGIALKIDDGGTRAAEVALAALLQRCGVFDPALESALAVLIFNRAGLQVGQVRAAAALRQ
ncbi:MAG: putative L-asparaginase [Alphaproteobacteria bacterium]|nr:putative L-asparaginase [Alphaproteobacteria bacterium]